MASIYDTAGQVFGRFGSGGRDLAAGQKNSHARLSQFIFCFNIGASALPTKPRKYYPAST